MNLFGDTLKEIRTNRRIKSAEFHSDFNPQAIYVYEKGRNLPSRERLDKITSRIVSIAEEQGSQHGADDGLRLESAWLQDNFTDLGVPDDIAQTLATIAMLEPEHRKQVADSIPFTLP